MTASPTPVGFTVLPWDSELFGFPVAVIQAEFIHADRWLSVQEALRAEGVRLAYASVDWTDTLACDSLRARGARQVDCKRRYRKPLTTECLMPDGLEGVRGRPCSADFESLALASGEYSRFRTDPNVPRGVFQNLYKIWIRRSLSGEIADTVLALFEGQDLAGMITVAASGETGVIGLVAVAAEHRGRGFGRRLVQGAEAWCAAQGLQTLEVITQGQNVPARALYAASGFSCATEEAVFHLWLEPEAR